LPNILSLIMLPAYLYMNRMIGGAWRTDMVLFSMSFVVSALSVVALMWNTGYLDLYISSIQFLYQSTELNHGPYNKYQLLVDYFHGYWVLCYSFLQMSAMLSISAYALMCIGRRSIVVSIVLGVFGGCLYYYLYPVVGIPVSGRMMSFVVVVGVFCLIYFLYYYTEPSLKKIVSVLMLLWIAVSPLGSGAGFVNHVYIIPFLFPMMAELLRIKALKGDGISLGDHAGDSISEHRISKFLVYKYMQKKIWSLDLVCKKEQAQQNMMSFKGAVVNNGFHFYFIGLVVMLIAIGSYSFTHDSTHERDKLTYSFDHEFMKGVYSTEENASSLNSLIMELSSVVKKGDVVYIPWGNPLIYYLTETKPFLKHPWSDIYSEDQLVNYYHTLCPPKVMVTYGYSDYAALIGDFARDNRYKKSWYNHDYTIYVRDEHSCDV